jgi:hypothetical protein
MRPDFPKADQVALNAILTAPAMDRGAQLNFAGHRLAYRSAMDHVQRLRRIDELLGQATMRLAPDALDYALGLARRGMLRGLTAAEDDVNPDGRAVFWLPL